MQLITQSSNLTMSSREIAELTGKQLSHVHRDIRAMLGAIVGISDGESTGASLDWNMRSGGMDKVLDHPEMRGVVVSWDARGYVKQVDLTKDLTMTLIAGYNIRIRHAIVKRWQELESQSIKPVEMSRMDILKLAIESEQARLEAIAERDHAIATKAQIGSRREATAMATAASAKREAEKLRDQLGFNARHATILAVEDITGEDYNFVPLRRWCKANEVTPQTVPDKRYPGGVKAWPAKAWLDVYGIDLGELFSVEVPA